MKKQILQTAFAAVILSSCSETPSFKKDENKNLEIIEIYGQVVSTDASNSSAILIATVSDESARPDEIYFQETTLVDNGQGNDKEKGDGIYTSIDQVNFSGEYELGKIIPIFDHSSNGENARLAVEQPCRIRIYGAGEDGPCGVCPEDSILGGSTWFCVCVTSSCY